MSSYYNNKPAYLAEKNTYNYSPNWAKNAASAAQKRALNRKKFNGSKWQQGRHSIGKNGRLTIYSRINKEGREFLVNPHRNSEIIEQIRGPGMPNTWLPETKYGKSSRKNSRKNRRVNRKTRRNRS